jgi:HK97 family phage major capsid protein
MSRKATPYIDGDHWVYPDGVRLARLRGGDGTEDERPLVEQLRDKRSRLLDETAQLVETREQERTEFEARTDATDEDRSTFAAAEQAFNDQFNERERQIKDLDRRIAEQEVVERRREQAARASDPSASVRSEPLTYRRDLEGKVSYWRDLAATVPGFASRMEDPDGAVARLGQHAQEMNVELPKRAAERERRAQAQVDQAEREFRASFLPGTGVERRGLLTSPFERRVNPNRTDGQGGYFVPPLYLIDDYISALRAGRVAANLARNLDLPQGTDSINIPKVSTGTSVDVQTADNAAVASADLTDTSVSASVKTIAGQEDVALQLIEQSPGSIMDTVITQDLFADYNRRVDRQVLLGTGSNGQILGILPAANWSALGVTWTNNPTIGHTFTHVLAAAASKVSYNRFSFPNFAYLLHGRRWFWYASALDASDGKSGRVIVNPSDTGFNVDAVSQGLAAEGHVGRAPFGPDVNISPNVPTTDNTDGGGATRDVGIAANWDDVWLFEGDLRTRVLSEVLSGTLQVRYQVYAYVTMLVRYGQSLCIATGAGFAPPTSAISTEITF